MTVLLIVIAAGLATYATRLAGLLLGERQAPATVERFLGYVPVAVFAALAAPGLVNGGEAPIRLLGAIAAAAAVLRFGQLWAGLVAGMTVYLLLRSLSG